MARADKAAAVAELSERFTRSAGIVLTDYRGLTVKALKDLRRSLGDDATYAVSKNTLTTIAARQAGVDGIEEHLVGPTAIAFIDGDPVIVAKGLRDFARTNPLLVIKGGVLDGKFLGPDEVRRLADLESREVLLAKVAGGMQGILQQAISLVAAPLSQAVRLFAALEQAAQDDPSLLAESSPADLVAAEVAAAEPTNEELPTAEAVSGEPAAEAATEEPAADAVAEEPAAEAASAAPAAPSAVETAVEDITPAPAAEDN
jgi:large subunit ribosomal protein L10